MPVPPRKTLVVPSIREHCLAEFLEAWKGKGGWDAVVVVEDNPERTFALAGADRVAAHYSWKEIDEVLGLDSWIISHRDSAIRAFGFLAAYHDGADFIGTLDDDCFPHPGHEDWFARHTGALFGQPRWVPSVPGVRTRGLPYLNRGRLPGVAANMGLWSNVADYDAVQGMTRLGAGETDRFEPPAGSRVIPRGQYFPTCGMSLVFDAWAAPLFYFPLMGVGSPYRRQDDLWAGVIAKKCLDHLGRHFAVGEPFVEHRRASDPFKNLVAEAPGIPVHEWLWEAVDALDLGAAATPVECARAVGEGLQGHPDPYVARLGRALQVWARLFSSPPPGATAERTTDG